MAIKQVKFKRLKVNSGFTLSVADGTMGIKISEKEYTQNYLGKQIKFKADPKQLVWADTIMVKPWWKL